MFECLRRAGSALLALPMPPVFCRVAGHRAWRAAGFWLVLTIAAALGLGGCSGSADGVSRPRGIVAEQGWWIDRSGRAELADVQQISEWTSFAGLTTFGFGPEPIWFKFRLEGLSEQAPPLWIMRVLPAYLDELTFHDPAAGRVLNAGRSVRPEGEMVSSINPSFPVPAMSQARDIYVRLNSFTTRLVLIDVLPYGEAAYLNRLQEWLFAALIALSAISVLWALTEWVVSRESVVGLFAIKQLIATAWGVVAAGFARILAGQQLPVGALTAAQSTLLPLTIAAGIAFVAALLNSYGPRRIWIRLLYGLVASFALLPVLQFFDLTREARMVANFCLPLVFLCLFLTLASVVHRRSDQHVPRPLLFFYLCAYSLLLSVPALINLGGLQGLLVAARSLPQPGASLTAVPISPWEVLAVYASLISLMLDGFVMRILLMRRAYAQKQAQRATELELQRSEEESKARRRVSEEQSRLFAMLAHEMKTPLATLRMWVHAGSAGRPAMERAISDMNLIIERCVHAGQLTEQGLQPIAQADDALAQTKAGIEASRDPGRFELCGPEGAAPILADTQMLSIVLGNLFDNAAKYSAPLSPIQVLVRAQARDRHPGWSWQISNVPGPAGMPEPARLFEKYYRSPGARHQSGSGLGLFLVRGLLDLMGGTIHFEARDGRAVFEVWLPATPEPR